MKEGIHPPYDEAVIRCACGEEVKTRSTEAALFAWISARTVIPSSQASRSSSTPADVSINSKSVWSLQESAKQRRGPGRTTTAASCESE